MALSPEQLAAFDQDGFVILPEFFTAAELASVKSEIDALVDSLAERLHAAGKIVDRHEDAGFRTRLALLERDYPGAAVLIHIGGILGPELARLWETPRLLDIVEQIIGPEIAGHPVWNLRSKTPQNALVTVPWHQDTAYLAAGAEATLQPTAWIPLVEANGRNGTLQVVRGGHRSGRVARHRLENGRGHKDSWYLFIRDDELPQGEIVTCEMPAGSILLFNQLLPHRSTENLSDGVRWSIDLRWQRPGELSGFEGIKEPILMRTAADPNYRIDWAGWSAQNRIADAMGEPPRESFSTAVTGPWMDRWRG
ncbi:MAG TPA: phytanoyl-CoA dioxygenase family protein [Chthonomonadaceae bacterium]|nr:phytanoyl-CoA dioxygenase family protein [Chthonomonadaceae bacterium]